MKRMIHQLQKLRMNKMSILFFITVGSIITLVVISISGFTSTNIQRYLIDMDSDTLKIDLQNFNDIHLVIEDSASTMGISIYETKISSVVYKNKSSSQGIEYNYYPDGNLERKSTIYWPLDRDSSILFNQYYMGDYDLLGYCMKDFLYNGPCLIYSKNPKPIYEIEYKNGIVLKK